FILGRTIFLAFFPLLQMILPFPIQYKQQVSKGFQPLPGQGQALSAQKYICPQGDYVWYRRVVGATIPTCPTHGVLLIPADQ
ncbi:hypothetical protein, partial [Trichormus variabilis]